MSTQPLQMEKQHGESVQRARRIRPLDASVVGLIAAGEVVERPSLAIKELVENSIDAQSRSISVDIKDGGLSYFRVTDNGLGIPSDELVLAFARSATSKLREASDLESVQTLGFRGEALASIAAVAKVTLVSRTRGSDTGAAIDIEGGRVLGIRDAASPEGTSITIKDIFYNTPARRKFMKKPAIEAAQVSDWITRLAMARPDISMRLSAAGKQSFRSAGDSSLAGVLASVWGRDAASRMLAIQGSAGGCYWEGFVGVGEQSYSNRSRQLLFLNGRCVRSQAVVQAVEWACRERVPPGRFTVCVLHVTMDFAQVDVNVHPNKLEVRFREETSVASGIAELIRGTLASSVKPREHECIEPPTEYLHNYNYNTVDKEDRPTPAAIHVAAYAAPEAKPVDDPRGMVLSAVDAPLSFLLTERTEYTEQPALPQAAELSEQQSMPMPESATPYKVIGAAFDQYIIVEQGDMLYLIDQHAAHERFLYDRFDSVGGEGAVSQPLLAPLVLTLTPGETALVEAYADTLADSDFTFEPFGDKTVRVTSAPVVLGCPAPELARAMIAALESFGELPSAQRRRDSLIKLACKKAIKGGEPLTRGQINHLLEQIASSVMPTCPHGRPICVAIPRREIDRRFKRT